MHAVPGRYYFSYAPVCSADQVIQEKKKGVGKGRSGGESPEGKITSTTVTQD